MLRNRNVPPEEGEALVLLDEEPEVELFELEELELVELVPTAEVELVFAEPEEVLLLLLVVLEDADELLFDVLFVAFELLLEFGALPDPVVLAEDEELVPLVPFVVTLTVPFACVVPLYPALSGTLFTPEPTVVPEELKVLFALEFPFVDELLLLVLGKVDTLIVLLEVPFA